jgi:phosphopantothenoylcysteine synthetase/decarboxylase
LPEKPLKNKKILITGGPVWVPIDKVRVMTNIFGGSLGLKIATKAAEMGGMAVFLLGPSKIIVPDNLPNNLKVIRFKYFDELLSLMKKNIVSGCDVVIHSAAIPDYAPKVVHNGKIKSGRKELIIKFKPTIKIVDLIKKWNSSVFLVKFKLEVGLNKKELINVAYNSMIYSHADLMVANDLNDIKNKHKAFIIDNNKDIIECSDKDSTAKKLLYKVIELS